MDDTYITEKTGLTICTVSFNSAVCLDLNYKLTEILNPSASVRWIVAENTPSVSKAESVQEDGRFHVIEGAVFPENQYAAASYHHAAAMNKTLQQVRTRFLLVLDPDFFIVRHNWIVDVIEHMITNSLSFFGAPWHPSTFKKWRYFPCVHCMFIDLERVPRGTLDFLPDFPTVPGYKLGRKDHSGMLDRAGRIILGILDPLKFRRRRHIGTSRDTSWRIYERYHADTLHKSECIQPVYYDPREDWQSYADFILPERYSLVPRKKGYFVGTGFREYGLTDFDHMQCEEFMWRNQPFGLHIRTNPKTTRGQSINTQLEAIERLVSSLQQEQAEAGAIPLIET
jgi:hypothetical protein